MSRDLLAGLVAAAWVVLLVVLGVGTPTVFAGAAVVTSGQGEAVAFASGLVHGVLWALAAVAVVRGVYLASAEVYGVWVARR